MATPALAVSRGTDTTITLTNVKNAASTLLTNSNASATITIYQNGPGGVSVLAPTAMTYVGAGSWNYRISGALVVAYLPLYVVCVVTDTSVSPSGLLQLDAILQEQG